MDKGGGMDKLDFGGKIILVAGGASGIGNGIAHAFRRKGGQVRVIGSRASPVEHSVDEGSGLDCNQQQSIGRWKDARKSRVQKMAARAGDMPRRPTGTTFEVTIDDAPSTRPWRKRSGRPPHRCLRM